MRKRYQCEVIPFRLNNGAYTASHIHLDNCFPYTKVATIVRQEHRNRVFPTWRHEIDKSQTNQPIISEREPKTRFLFYLATWVNGFISRSTFCASRETCPPARRRNKPRWKPSVPVGLDRPNRRRCLGSDRCPLFVRRDSAPVSVALER